MKTMLTRARYAAILSSAVACAAVGCNGNAPANDDEVAQITAALEMEDGGLGTQDEAPQFGEAAAFAKVDAHAVEAPVADPIAASEPAKAIMAAPAALRIRATVLWGQIPVDPGLETKVIDWSGKISVNRGALLVRRSIAFEPKTDAVLPRNDIQTVAFTSKTLPAHDGLRLEIIDPTPANGEPLALSYENAHGVKFSVPVAALLDGPKTKVVDAQGDRVVAMAHLMPPVACELGTLGGHWHPLLDGPKGVGRLAGIVRNDDGDPIGHMKGIYGHRKNGDEVFFGKYIDAQGHFRGLFKGRYDHGRFLGRWVVTSGDHGFLGGEYVEDAPGDAIGGHYMGRWAETSCKLPPVANALPPEMGGN
jgi:hypothetical protein